MSDAERIKRESHGLRGTLAEELASDATHLSEDARLLLKFHGSYQGEDRDQRRERKKAGLEPAYQFFTRSRVPGGVLSAEQYLVHDDLAGEYGNGTLRVTTRQTIQLHGIIKKDLRTTIHELNERLVSTLATCGDVGRNVVSCPAHLPGAHREETFALARRLSDKLLPRTSAYHEIWVEGEKVSLPEAEPDPLYGKLYLPRKFKTAIGFADDNCMDLYSNDLAFVAVLQGDRLIGYNVLVGGGLGQTHGKADTHPRLADPLAFVRPADVEEVAQAVVAVQRDHGNRTERRRARLKYTIEDHGLEWFRDQVERVIGRALEPPVPLEVTEVHDHLGWHEQANGKLLFGVFIENGRIGDHGALRLRTALRRVVEEVRPAVHLTPQQNLLLTDIPHEQRAHVQRTLASHGVIPHEQLTPLRRWAMSCPALPTCGLAVAEAERALPGVVTELEQQLEEIGLGNERVVLRMTGCPNGCARPYTAEVALVGRSLGKYVLYVGGSHLGTRLATKLADLVPLDQVTPLLRPLLERWRDERLPAERFGDFCHRADVTAVPAGSSEYQSSNGGIT